MFRFEKELRRIAAARYILVLDFYGAIFATTQLSDLTPAFLNIAAVRILKHHRIEGEQAAARDDEHHIAGEIKERQFAAAHRRFVDHQEGDEHVNHQHRRRNARE